MFVATSTKDQRRINLLDPAAFERLESLKALGREGGLVCPHCGQELRVRHGDLRRPHFAHKSLEDCPFHKESAEVTEVKALLYGFFLQQRVGPVEMDISLDGGNDSGGLYLDLLVETGAGKRLGYWVFDRDRRDRHILLDAARESGIFPMVIHTGSMLACHSPDNLLLSKSMRDTIQSSPFDQGFGTRAGGHLHFLDDAGVLSTFRRLHCVHLPNVYAWEIRREAALREVRFDPASGDFVVVEDVADRLEHLRLEREREEKRRREEEERKKIREERVSSIRTVVYTEAPVKPLPAAKIREPQKPYVNPLNQLYPCKICGVETRDWVSLLPSEGVCVCRECNAKRLKV